MDSEQHKGSSSPFEYFLYAAILAETALAVVIYIVILHSGELMRLSVYFAVFYLAFLAWVITQLNRLRRGRKTAIPDSTPVAEAAAQYFAVEDTRRVFGLTGAQLVIVVVVFATAVVTFSWALGR
jgi:hypothetical protein